MFFVCLCVFVFVVLDFLAIVVKEGHPHERAILEFTAWLSMGRLNFNKRDMEAAHSNFTEVLYKHTNTNTHNKYTQPTN